MLHNYEIRIVSKGNYTLQLLCTIDDTDGKGVLLLKELTPQKANLPIESGLVHSALVKQLTNSFQIESDKWDIETNLWSYLQKSFPGTQIQLRNKSTKKISQEREYKLEPISFQVLDNRIKLEVANIEKFVRYEVLFGTNRSKSNGKSHYGSGRGTRLTLGHCSVSIPEDHETGTIERPNWFRKILLGESPEKHFTILGVDETDPEKFMATLQERFAQSGEADILLFIHGFNVTFDEAMLRAAQLGYDLNFKGAVTAFAWPSLGKVGGYVADMDSARLAGDYLAEYIKLLLTSNAQKLHIIAHSMGNVTLTEALLKLKMEGTYPTQRITQLILAAPDLDKDIFTQQIMPNLGKTARMTLYASANDKALLASEKIRDGYDRLGQGGAKLTIVDDVDSIDASYVDTSLLGHGYFAETRILINDIHQVLMGIPPTSRLLDEKKKLIDGALKKYWLFKR